MTKQFLKIYQIYFDEAQLARIEFEPYFNQDCTVYFESSVIRDLIAEGHHLDSEYFAVVSYKLRDKVGMAKTRWKNIPQIANHSPNEFSPELFTHILQRERPDVMSFQKHSPHDPVTFANNFHPNFSKYFAHIMKVIGYDWKPIHFHNVFYCNYFAAKSEIYQKFVTEMLNPAMKVMDTMPELMGDSRYPHPLPEHLKGSFGINHYPYHAFICERMFSYYAHLKTLTCLHY